MNIRNIISGLMCSVLALGAGAAEPSGYYKTCEGKKGAALLSQLQNVVGSHTNVGYDGLWDVYRTSDVRANGTIWDMYSTKEWTFGKEKCGNYKNVGDCYNREHSMPKSWFNDAAPMYSDAYHLYPTDGKVNGQRSNYPYGECSGGTTLPSNGNVKALGKLGKSTFSGYSGTVFEPDDEYKGDFARSYFYMAAAYNDKIKSWKSDMLAGNAYPAFSSWAVQLLLKWHRQDPVSQKELDRNEAVYAHQHNRNPFIDHPDMVEHIWGERQSEGWKASGDDPVPTPVILRPADGSVLDLGSTITGVARTAELYVQGSDLTADVTITVTGSEFTVSPSTIRRNAANTGSTATVTYLPVQGNSHTATLTVASGEARATVTLTGSAIDHLPAGPVTAIGEDAFVATWSYIGDALPGELYSIALYEGGSLVAGYPVQTSARAEQLYIGDLTPATTYTYTVSSQHLTSPAVSVTTLAPAPEVNVLFDGDFHFTATKGEPSEAAELWIEILNIYDPVTLAVPEPFELSTDKSRWATTAVLDPEEDRVYMRMYSQKAGSFHGSMIITAPGYMNDDVVFTGTATATDGFFEDFEADAEGMGSYSQKYYNGTGSTWDFVNAGMWPTQDEAYDSEQCVRMGKESNSTIEMTDDYAGGFGTLTLWSRTWSSNDGPATFELEYSTDGGQSWDSAGSATAASANYEQYKFAVNVPGPARIRVRQTEGKRFFIDQIEADNFTSLVPDFAADYHTWDAYSCGGKLVIETTAPITVNVYSLDGTEVFASRVAPGTRSIALGYGLYIVSVDDFARRVLVK